MFGNNNPYQTQYRRRPESFSQKFNRFLKTQPVLALLIGQAIALYIYLPATFFYGLIFVLLLYFGGVFLRQFYSDIVLLAVYITGAASGYFFYTLMFGGSLAAPNELHIAAIQGSAVFSTLTFIAAARPDLKMRMFLLMQIRFWHIAAILIIIALLRKDISGGGTHLCYLGGTLTAGIGALLFARNVLASPWAAFRKKFDKRRNRKFVRYETVKETGRPLKDEEYNDIRAERQKRIDEILDKISRSGYDSLTKDEKELLFRQSK